MSKKNRQRKIRESASSMFCTVDAKFANDFIKRIEDLAKQSNNHTAIVTFSSSGRNWNQVFDVIDKQNGELCEWGYQEGYRIILSAKLANSDTYPLSVVVRTFTRKHFPVILENKHKILIPGKQIRMFYLPKYGELRQLSAEECFACMNTDSRTGMSLSLDPTLEYFGEK